MTEPKPTDWGKSAISQRVVTEFRKVLPEGKTILELGSGWGTGQLKRYWNIWSVEDQDEWAGKYHDQFFHIPLKEHAPIPGHGGTVWYDPDLLRESISSLQYDLLFIDGPHDNRAGFIKYFDLFDHTVPMFFDDVSREPGLKILQAASELLDREYTIIAPNTSDTLGVILP